jgi:hypothetical protein
MARKKQLEKYTVVCTYWDSKSQVVKVNHAKNGDSACERTSGHMMRDSYNAMTAQVADDNGGRLLAIYSWKRSNLLETLFKVQPVAFKKTTKAKRKVSTK